MRLLSAIAASASLLAAPAFAESFDGPSLYGTLGYSAFDGQEAELGAITGRIGAKLHPNFGAEAEGSIGVKKDDLEFSINGSGEYELKHDAAIYAVGFLPLHDRFELFARVGYGKTNIESSVRGVPALQDGSSVNYGLGANVFFTDADGLRADWTRRDFKDDKAGEADTWSVSYIRRF